jgi:GT2 family glycosyltransferase
VTVEDSVLGGEWSGSGAAVAEVQVPCAVRLVDIEPPARDLVVGDGYRTVLVLARGGGRPLGMLTLPAGADGTVAAAVLEEALARAIGTVPQGAPAAVSSRSVSVVVTTCRNPGPLERCLQSVLACDPAPAEVVVVENRPGTGVTAALLQERFADRPVRLVEESRRGLSWARNAGLYAAESEVVAFTDDDVVVDPGWVGRLASSFDRADDVGCVTGLIVPLSLDTEVQLWIERLASFNKGFETREWRMATREQHGRLFPYACGEFGSGANTAVLAREARAIGGFDVRLGAGTPAWGGEELDLYLRMLQAGHALVYEPSALLWHDHPNHPERLRSEAFHYGIGLTAMLCKHALLGSSRRDMWGRAFGGLRHVADPGSRKNAGKAHGYPRGLDALERAGMLLGPAAYLRSRLQGTTRTA